MEEVNFNETTKTESVESEKALKCDSNEPKKSKTPAMFKAGIALMCATSALSVGAIGACGFLGYKLYKNQKNQDSDPQDSMESVVASKQPTISEDGYWVINGVKTQFKAEVADGEDGQDGISVVNASIVQLDKWGITTQIQFKMSDNSYIVTAPQTQIMSEHFYEAEDMSDILTLTEGYGISKIKLSNNVYLSSSIKFDGDTIIDLNRKTLDYVAINPLKVDENSSLTLKNGSVNFQTSVGVSVEGENAELTFEKVSLSATSTVAETLETNASITLTNTTIQTIQPSGMYGASRVASVGSLFNIKGENASITVTGSKFNTNKSIVSASENATEFKIVVKETKINTTAPILDVNTDEVVPTLDIDNSTMQNSSVTELNTSPITSGSFNVDPTELGATLEGVEKFDVNGSTVLASDFASLVEIVDAGSTINLSKDIELETAVVVDKKLTVNLADYSIYATEDTAGDGIFRVVTGGELTIESGEFGSICGTGNNIYNMALWANGGKIIINGGMYDNYGAGDDDHYDLIYASAGGQIVINDGYFFCETPKWTLNLKDNSGSSIIVNGGMFFGYNPAESHTENPVENFVGENKLVAGFDGRTMFDYEGTVYTVTSSDKFAECLTTGYTFTFEEDGETYSFSMPVDYIFLNGDVVLEDGIDIDGQLTLNLQNCTISAPEIDELAVFRVHGMLTINGNGTINSASQNNDCSIAVWARNGGYVEINGGTYTNLGALSKTETYACNNELIYTSGDGSTIIINDGNFIGNYENEKWGTRYTLNKHDSTESSIIVKGGTFYDYNPSESLSENPVENFVPETHFVYGNGTTYSVAPVTDIVNVVNTNGVNYVELNNHTILETALVINKKMTINLKNFVIAAPEDTAGDGIFRVVEGGDLTIEAGEEGCVYGTGNNEYNMAVWANGGKVTINGGYYTNPDAGSDDHYDLIYASNGGQIIINAGWFEAHTPKWTLNLKDNSGSSIVVNGGYFFGFDPSASKTENPVADFVADGTIVVSDGYTYAVVTPNEFLDYAEFEEINYIKLYSDIELPRNIVVDHELTINLNGHTITRPTSTNSQTILVVSGGDLTIEGEGTISGLGLNSTAIAVWAYGGKVTINGGTFTNVGAGNDDHYDLIYASNGGEIIVNDGNFICETPSWALNMLDQDRDISSITVYGGTFYGFNPANNAVEGNGTNFVAEGYKAVADGNNFVVVAE